MSTRENKELIARLLDAHQRHDVAAVSDILSPRLEWNHAGSDDPLDKQDYLAGMEMGHAAFPEMRIVAEDMLAENDRVAVRLSHRMRHDGEFLGIPPTGRTVTFTGFWIYRIAAGQVEEAWSVDEDFTSQLRDSGAPKPA